MRAYICERPAKRSDGSDGNTSTSDEVETQTSATTTSCGVETTTWPDVCASRARAKADEIESEINATKTANSQVIGTIALGDAAAGTTWLGGSASFANLAQSAIDFGRSIGKLCTEVCSIIFSTLFHRGRSTVSLFLIRQALYLSRTRKIILYDPEKQK